MSLYSLSEAQYSTYAGAGISYLKRYYGPVRHPILPGLAIAGCLSACDLSSPSWERQAG